MKKTNENIRFLFILCKPYFKYQKKYVFISLVFWAGIVPLTRMLNVLFPEVVMNSINSDMDIRRIILIVLLFQIALFLIPAFEDYFNVSVRDPAEADVKVQVNREIYEYSLRIDYKYIDDPQYYKSYTWTVEHYAEQCQKAFSFLNSLVSAVIVIVSLSVLLSTANPFLVLLIISGMIIRTYGYIKYNHWYVRRDKKLLSSEQRMQYYHRLFYMKEYNADLRSTHLKDIVMKDYAETAGKRQKEFRNAAPHLSGWGIFSDFIYHVTMFLIIMCIVYSFYTGKLSDTSTYVTVMLAVDRLNDYLSQLFDLIQQGNRICLYSEEIDQFFHMASNDTQQGILCKGETVPYSIDINYVSFRYPDRSFCLKDIDIHIKKGERIAIVGKNGAGKTTLVKLLLHFYEPEQGTICLNGNQFQNTQTILSSISA